MPQLNLVFIIVARLNCTAQNWSFKYNTTLPPRPLNTLTNIGSRTHFSCNFRLVSGPACVACCIQTACLLGFSTDRNGQLRGAECVEDVCSFANPLKVPCLARLCIYYQGLCVFVMLSIAKENVLNTGSYVAKICVSQKPNTNKHVSLPKEPFA